MLTAIGVHALSSIGEFLIWQSIPNSPNRQIKLKFPAYGIPNQQYYIIVRSSGWSLPCCLLGAPVCMDCQRAVSWRSQNPPPSEGWFALGAPGSYPSDQWELGGEQLMEGWSNKSKITLSSNVRERGGWIDGEREREGGRERERERERDKEREREREREREGAENLRQEAHTIFH